MSTGELIKKVALDVCQINGAYSNNATRLPSICALDVCQINGVYSLNGLSKLALSALDVCQIKVTFH